MFCVVKVVSGVSLNQVTVLGLSERTMSLEMAADKNELRTELARLSARHSPANPEGLRFVRSGKHNPAANRNRLPAQRRVEHLLDRGINASKSACRMVAIASITDPLGAALEMRQLSAQNI
jgi:hypothetical protein